MSLPEHDQHEGERGQSRGAEHIDHDGEQHSLCCRDQGEDDPYRVLIDEISDDQLRESGMAKTKADQTPTEVQRPPS